MTREAFAAALETTGLPFTFHHFTNLNGQPAPLPCVVFDYPASDDLLADNINYCKIDEVVVKLYTENKNFQLEAQLGALLNGLGMAYEKETTWIESEQLFETIYTTEETINGE